MDRLIYTAVSGLSSSMVRQRMIANNMANAQTIGFRAETMQFTPMTLDGPSLEVRAINSTEVRGASMKAGSVTQTGGKMDIAMSGDAMLTVQAPDGGEGYPRRGDLSVSPTGVLQNGDSLPVIGENGPITVPPGSVISIAQDGAVMSSTYNTRPLLPIVMVDGDQWAVVRDRQLHEELWAGERIPGFFGT